MWGFGKRVQPEAGVSVTELRARLAARTDLSDEVRKLAEEVIDKMEWRELSRAERRARTKAKRAQEAEHELRIMNEAARALGLPEIR